MNDHIKDSAILSITNNRKTCSPKRDYTKLYIKLNTGDTLLWESLHHVENPKALFNRLLSITKSYMKTKQILRDEYRVFILITK